MEGVQLCYYLHDRFFSFLQQLSQFWYNDDTALVLAKEALKAANNGR